MVSMRRLSFSFDLCYEILFVTGHLYCPSLMTMATMEVNILTSIDGGCEIIVTSLIELQIAGDGELAPGRNPALIAKTKGVMRRKRTQSFIGRQDLGMTRR